MNMSELAARMLEWEDTQRKADALRSEIEAAVMDLGRTQTVGNVRASYSAGRKSYDYEAAAKPVADEETVARFTTPKVDWKGICEHVGISDVPFTQAPASVTVKLMA